MYRSHYSLAIKPFQLTTDPRFLWLGEAHKEALATLKYGVIDQKGFLLVTGDIGTGKTTLINALLESIEEDTLVANITDPALNLIEFFNFVALSFNIPQKFESKIDFIVYFKQFLKKVNSENRSVLLIIDEVHRVSKEVLEHIRLLSNIELPDEKLVNMFFVGQNEIHQTLALPECRALRQRISLVYQIEPLSENETLAYIKHRLKVAGTEKSIFTQDAVREIYQFSKGYPRLINIICDHALLTGYARDLKKITPDVIMECAQQFNSIGKPWNKNHLISKVSNSRRLRKRKFIWKPVLSFATRMQKELFSRATAAVPFIKHIQKTLFSWISAAVPFIKRNQKRLSSRVSAASLPTLLQNKRLIGTFIVSFAVMILVIAGLYQKALTMKNNLPNPSSQKTEISKPNVLEQAKTALHNKNFNRSIVLFEQVIAQNPATAPKINIYYSKALQGQADSIFIKNPGTAQMLLSKAIEADPENAEAHFDLGRLYTKSKNYPKAIKAYEKAANLNHRPSDVFYNLGFIYASINNFANAEKMFLHVVDLKPPYIDKALFNLAVVQQKQGKQQECIENLEKAMINNPRNQRVQQYLNQLKN